MTPITFAHRGARLLHPENTIPAFRAGLEHGASGLETDAWLSADGEVVLTHDAGVRGPWLRYWRMRVHRTTAERLAKHGVPRLADLYEQLGSDYELSIDVKDPAVAQPIIEAARHQGTAHRTWLCSPDLDALRDLRPVAADVRLVHSTPRRHLPTSMERHAADLAAAGIDTLNLRHSEWTRGLVALFHRFDVRAFAWDVQEIRDLRGMLGIGIDAVYCDHVERMVATVRDWVDQTER